MFVANVLCEHGGEIIDQSGAETRRAHILFINSVYMYTYRESVCPYNTCICIMFHSSTEHFHICHLAHTAALWDKLALL